MVYWFLDVHNVVCLFFLGVFGFLFIFSEALTFFQLTGRCRTFSPKHLLKYKKNYLSTKRQVKTRNVLKLFNMHWILSTMHPKWGRSPSLTFYFDIYSQEKISKNYFNLTIHANYTKLIESLHEIQFLIFNSTKQF